MTCQFAMVCPSSVNKHAPELSCLSPRLDHRPCMAVSPALPFTRASAATQACQPPQQVLMWYPTKVFLQSQVRGACRPRLAAHLSRYLMTNGGAPGNLARADCSSSA